MKIFDPLPKSRNTYNLVQCVDPMSGALRCPVCDAFEDEDEKGLTVHSEGMQQGLMPEYSFYFVQFICGTCNEAYMAVDYTEVSFR